MDDHFASSVAFYANDVQRVASLLAVGDNYEKDFISPEPSSCPWFERDFD